LGKNGEKFFPTLKGFFCGKNFLGPGKFLGEVFKTIIPPLSFRGGAYLN